jgi:radical SAM superfamily enzyme YgiQ (UPF0313 family)
MLRLLYAKECNHPQPKAHSFKVCLLYPGSFRAGISSLGVQKVYSILNSTPGVVCDLCFEDTDTSVMLGLKLKDFDLVAVSITYENQLFALVSILKKAGIEPLREQRNHPPLLLGGGIAVTYNPVPYTVVFDVIYIGEAEKRLKSVVNAIATGGLKTASSFDNVLVPAIHQEGTERKRIYIFTGFPNSHSHSCILSENSAFSSMFLVELTRGCRRKCAFCVTSRVFSPYREKEISTFKEEVEVAVKTGKKIGLIATDISLYSSLDKLLNLIRAYKLEVSLSSVGAKVLSPAIFEILKESRQKTITIAPETGNESLRFALGKKVKDEDYFAFAEKAMKSGVKNLKLYFLIGLPKEDLKDIVRMTKKFLEVAKPFWKERGVPGRLQLSINPVVAKPFTPFQWFGMNHHSQISKKLKWLSKELSRLSGVKLTFPGHKEYVLQALLSRANTQVGRAVVLSALKSVSLRRTFKELGLNLDECYTREREEDEPLPWESVVENPFRQHLLAEFKNLRSTIGA